MLQFARLSCRRARPFRPEAARAGLAGAARRLTPRRLPSGHPAARAVNSRAPSGQGRADGERSAPATLKGRPAMTHPFHVNDPRAVIEADRAHVWHHLIQHKPFETVDPRIIVEGKGVRVWDITGKEHIDAVSGGVWTVNVGYGRTEIADVIRDQLVKLPFFAGASGTIPGARFAERLIEKMPGMTRVYYANSGSEANEKAFKMVRQIAHKRHGGRKNKILYRDRDYHGTTIGCLSAGGQQERNAQYGPFAPGFVAVPHCLEYRKHEQPGAPEENYGEWAAEQIEQVILREGPDTVGALCLEPVTAGGGVIAPPPGYWEKVQEICRRHEVLLHIDEVVCGVGRTGAWFGYQQYGVQPDIVTMAKGVASGYAAISACVTTEAVFEMFKDDADDPLNYFRDISTFGGCTSGPAAALENMRIIEDEGLLENTDAMGARLMENLHALMDKHRVIGDVRGKGLFCGAELVADRETKEPVPEKQVQAVVADCMGQGVIIGATNRSVPSRNNTLCFSPPLISTADDIDAITNAVDGALGRVFG
jgi:taurine-pyruvate aminotransferase